MSSLTESTNILAAILAILPTFLYSLVIYFMLPKKMVSFRRMRKYFGVGLASPLIVMLIHYIFPNLLNFDLTAWFFSPLIIYVFILAGIEELSKYATFEFLDRSRKNVKHDYPIATMMYCLSTAAGFAIVENFHYAMMYGNDVLLIRGISANILHLLCGMLIGYFVAKSKMIQKPIWTCKKPIWNKVQVFIKKYSVVSFGILVSTLYHTLYNSNIYISGGGGYSHVETTFAIFVIGIFVTYYMARELVIKSKKIRYEKYGKKRTEADD